jgi:hypothetical protein
VRSIRTPVGNHARVASNVTAIAAAHRAAIRLTAPGTLFGSTKTSGRRARRAASAAGALA